MSEATPYQPWDPPEAFSNGYRDPDATASQLRAAAELLDAIGCACEDVYCEGWTIGCEPELWECVRLGRPVGAWETLPQSDVDDMRHLARHARCWWVWRDDAPGVVMIPLSLWEAAHGSIDQCPEGARKGTA